MRESISYFESFNSSPELITIEQFIEYCKTGWRFEQLITEYRQTKDKTLKKRLPIVTVGAICEGGRKLENVKKKTGWVAIDIDAKDNPHLAYPENVRDEISKISYIAYSGLSVSSKGVWALVKIKNADKQAEHFEQLKTDFKRLGIHLDPSKGKNPNDARFLSYDPDAIIKSDFQVYDRLPLQSSKPKRKKFVSPVNGTSDISSLIQVITNHRINIAPDYETYRNIGFAIASEYGERGRELFHQIVCHSPKYNQRDADKQYTNGLRSGRDGITIATFYYYCKELGLI